MSKPELNEISIVDALRAMSIASGQIIVTMSPGQWDALLEAAYNQGAVLLELDDDEDPRRAYRKGG